MEKFGLTARNRKIITDILAAYPEVERAIIYGSRARGSHQLGSDIDLTLQGESLTGRILAKIAHDLDDSDSPIYLIYPFTRH